MEEDIYQDVHRKILTLPSHERKADLREKETIYVDDKLGRDKTTGSQFLVSPMCFIYTISAKCR